MQLISLLAIMNSKVLGKMAPSSPVISGKCILEKRGTPRSGNCPPFREPPSLPPTAENPLRHCGDVFTSAATPHEVEIAVAVVLAELDPPAPGVKSSTAPLAGRAVIETKANPGFALPVTSISEPQIC